MWKRLYVWLLRRLGNLDGITRALASTGGRYLNAEVYAVLEGISKKSAQHVLREAVKAGILRKAYLYHSPELSVPIVLDEEDLDKEMPLAEFGIDAGPDEKVFLSRFSTTEIYIGREG